MAKACSRMIGFAGALAAALVVSAGPACAGCLVPAPLVGVTGPYGIVAAIVGYGGYLLVRRFRSRD